VRRICTGVFSFIAMNGRHSLSLCVLRVPDSPQSASTAYGRRQRNWIDAHGSVPARQVVDASCGNKHSSRSDIPTCVSELSNRAQVPKDCQACSQAENRSAPRCSGRRYGREEPQPISLGIVCGCAVGQGFSTWAAGWECEGHEGRGVV
jgi:hypothetical protein